jgi:uncharacterized membrane-anchored protein YitT (DUF2179 family)
MPPTGWSLSIGLGLLLAAFGSFFLHATVQQIRLNGLSLESLLFSCVMIFAIIAWGIVFIRKGLRQLKSRYARVKNKTIAGTVSLSASALTASLSVTNYLQYLEDKSGLQRCIESLCFASGKFDPLFYYHDFIIYSIAGGILSAIGISLLYQDRKRAKALALLKK